MLESLQANPICEFDILLPGDQVRLLIVFFIFALCNPCFGIGGGDLVSKDRFEAKSTVNVILTQEKIQQTCSGTLIAPDLVLTAGHCLTPYLHVGEINQSVAKFAADPSQFIVYFGNIQGFDLDPKFAVLVDAVLLHPGYDDSVLIKNQVLVSNAKNDLGLIKLKTQAPPSFSPAPLLKDSKLLPPDGVVSIAGYGEDAPGNNELDHHLLRDFKTKVLVPSDKEGHILLYSAANHTGMLDGDSGGPLFVQNFLGGVASHYSFDETPVYESVLSHLDWIIQSAKEMGSYLR